MANRIKVTLRLELMATDDKRSRNVHEVASATALHVRDSVERIWVNGAEYVVWNVVAETKSGGGQE